MNDRIIIILSSFLVFLGAVGYYEKRSIRQLKTNTELHGQLQVISLNCYKRQQKIKKLQGEMQQIKSACQTMGQRCWTSIQKCSDIIKNKKNCAYEANFLQRNP